MVIDRELIATDRELVLLSSENSGLSSPEILWRFFLDYLLNNHSWFVLKTLEEDTFVPALRFEILPDTAFLL